MKSLKFILPLLMLLVIGSSVVQIGVSNALSTGGIGLNAVEVQLAYVKKENTILREELYTQSSLTQIASKAATMGFVEAKSEVTIDNPTPLSIGFEGR